MSNVCRSKCSGIGSQYEKKKHAKIVPHQPSNTFSPRKTRKPTLPLTASACKSLPLPLVKLGVVTACSTYIHAGKRKPTGRVVVSSPPPPSPFFSPQFSLLSPPLPFCHGGAAALLLSSSLFKFMDGEAAWAGRGREEKMRGQDFHGEFLTRRWGRGDASAAVGGP